MFCLFSEVSKYDYSTTYKYEVEDGFENSQKLTFRRLSKKCSLSSSFQLSSCSSIGQLQLVFVTKVTSQLGALWFVQ